MQVYERLTLGKSNKEIADELHITVRTVKFHVGNIFQLFGVPAFAGARYRFVQSSAPQLITPPEVFIEVVKGKFE